MEFPLDTHTTVMRVCSKKCPYHYHYMNIRSFQDKMGALLAAPDTTFMILMDYMNLT